MITESACRMAKAGGDSDPPAAHLSGTSATPRAAPQRLLSRGISSQSRTPGTKASSHRIEKSGEVGNNFSSSVTLFAINPQAVCLRLKQLRSCVHL